jgi:hypothetical protein
MDVRVAPTSEEMVLVCFSGYGTSHVFKSYDAGDNWTDISAGLPDVPVNAVAIHPSSSNIIFAGTDLGVFMSTDAGENWSDLSDGLPEAVIVKSLQITESDNIMKAATHGSGVFQIQLPDIALSVRDDETVVSDFHLYQNYPNPFNPTTVIKYSIPSLETQNFASQHVKLTIYDILGREITTLINKRQSPGDYSVIFDAKELTSGVYFYRLSVGSKVKSKKMILLK